MENRMSAQQKYIATQTSVVELSTFFSSTKEMSIKWEDNDSNDGLKTAWLGKKRGAFRQGEEMVGIFVFKDVSI